MYNNLIKEMKKQNIKLVDLSKLLCVHRNTVRRKLFDDNGKIKIPEAQMIQSEYFPGLDIDYLFKFEVGGNNGKRSNHN